jgi:hypothetical protein
MTFKYRMRHLTTNRSWVKEYECDNRALFLATLRKWNASNPQYTYSEVI